MIEVKERQDAYFAGFAQLEERQAGRAPVWLHDTRKAALERFAELGFPTTRMEAWRFTNVAPIAKTRFELARYEFNPKLAEKLKREPLADLGCSRLVFLNGRYCRELSSTADLPPGVNAGSLAEVLAEAPASLESHLARYAQYQDHTFVALNTAFLEDGAFVEIPKGLVLEKPIYLLFVSMTDGQPTVTHPRNLVVVGRESQATVIEGHVRLGEGVYFSNAVSEVVAGENAVVNYCKVQKESERAYHLGTLHLRQERASSVATFALAFGAALSRQEVSLVLDGEGAESTLYGLYMASGRQHVDNYTTIEHAQPRTGSRELYNGVLDGKSSAVFHGRIVVRPGAQKTDAKQSNKNLLLSDDATVNTKPQLEIYADDVKCTHGATIGQIDRETIFYLRSRGIGLDEARSMLTYAFANEIISRLNYEPLRARLTDALFARLSNL